MNEIKIKRIRYDYNFLQKLCKENNIELKKDFSKINLNRDIIIETKCLSENCNDDCIKTFRQLLASGSFCKSCTMKNSQEKSKQTNLEIYGCENPSQNAGVKEKKIQTCMKNFGCEHPSQSEEVKEKMKQTCIEIYGCENPGQSEEVKEKMKQTCMKIYGCEHQSQNAEISEKQSKNAYKSKDYTFPSGRIEIIQGYEHFMLNDLLKENISEDDISVKRNEVPTVWYIDENEKKHRYYVDCFIKSQNRCIEAKSTWTAEKKKYVIFLKQKALKDAGYECEIWIYNNKGEKVECHK